ncbi:hypothetical protein [Pseudomonas typographi]|nr:hypothetical protein [Pseudomonas typographi]MBD1599513.1 hypothetical protein [Pseudomonas typographi]
MLDSLKTLADAGEEPLLISAQALASAQQQRRLQAEAQRRARQLVEQAQQEAQALRLAAYREGYVQGITHAAADVAQWLLGEQG